jgi:hypothetical protein
MLSTRIVRYLESKSRRQDRRKARVLTRVSRSLIGVSTVDRVLHEGEEASPGTHLLTPRLTFAHHGIYVGDNKVVHYGGLGYQWHRGPVEEVLLSCFAQGHAVWVRRDSRNALTSQEVIRRARSRLGENSYRLLSNNCEHFCEWCSHGEHRSRQVERALALPRRLAHALTGVVRRFLECVPRTG